MRHIIIASVLTMMSFTSSFAADIDLPQPQKTGGMPLMEALSNRKSTREFSCHQIQL